MYFDASTTNHNWSTGWSTIRSTIHRKSGHEFRVLQVPASVANWIPYHDRGGENVFALHELLEFRNTKCSLPIVDQWRCVIVQNQLHALANVLSCASILQLIAPLWDDAGVWAHLSQGHLSGLFLLLQHLNASSANLIENHIPFQFSTFRANCCWNVVRIVIVCQSNVVQCWPICRNSWRA